ncbi:redoxin family protein [Aromatoleum diolicum]|uniref:Redoxin family protein n=1 Tax=Aromatoleum diolicum TaxID=75796 RepID=A0ABX1QBI1_9RHOO|nr:redoxin family protein [Aromatoleum diolicum]
MRHTHSRRQTGQEIIRHSVLGKIIRALALVFSTLLLSLPQATRAAGKDAIATLPAIAMVTLHGSSLSIAEWVGKPTVVNIWATWCPPCRTEMPSLQRLSEMLEPSGIRVTALSVDNDQNLVREFALKYGIKLPIAIATSPSQAMTSLGAMALPLTLYVGADGRILGQHLGQRDWASDTVMQEVKQILLAPGRSKH